VERDEFEVVEESNLLAELGQRYLPYWPLFVIFTIISLTSAFFYLKYTTPIYESSAVILVKDDKKGVDASKVLDALDVFGEKKIVENEVEILKSWPIMKSVVLKLGLYSHVFRKGNIRDVELYGKNLPVFFKAVKPDSLVIQKGFKQQEFTIQKNGSIVINNKTYNNNDTVRIAGNDFIVKVLLFNLKEKENTTYYFTFNNLLKTSKGLSGGLIVEASSKMSTIIDINIKDNIPERGEDILNTLINEYQSAALVDKNKVASNTLEFIDKRLKVVLTDLDNVESNIKNFRTKEGILNLSAQSEIFLKSVQDNDEKISVIDIQLSVLKEVENYIYKKGNNPGTVPSLIGVSDPILAQLLTKLYEAEITYNQQQKISGEKSNLVVNLKQEIAKIKTDLLENVSNIRTSLLTSKNDIKLNLAKANTILNGVPEKEKQLIEISRQQTIKNSIYTFLLQKREETAISYMSSVSDSRVIESATTGGSVSPNVQLIYLITLAMGIGFSAIYVIILDQLNNKILFRRELEQKTGVPILGELMQGEPSLTNLAIKNGNRSMLAEQIRSVRTNMEFFGLKNDKKVVLINSTISGEGKTFVAINLAASFTLIGKKVAILELDLRKPKIAKDLLKTKNAVGITNYLSGNATLDDIIHRANDLNGLFVIPAGIIPPNPSELINSEEFKQMIDQLKQKFDYLILDSPPISLVTDAQLLSKLSDMVVYVVRHNYTQKVYLNMIAELYRQNKHPNMSILFNGVKPRGYGYGYG